MRRTKKIAEVGVEQKRVYAPPAASPPYRFEVARPFTLGENWLVFTQLQSLKLVVKKRKQISRERSK